MLKVCIFFFTLRVNIIWIILVWPEGNGIPKKSVVRKKNRYPNIKKKLTRWHFLWNYDGNRSVIIQVKIISCEKSMQQYYQCHMHAYLRAAMTTSLLPSMTINFFATHVSSEYSSISLWILNYHTTIKLNCIINGNLIGNRAPAMNIAPNW